MDFEKLKDAAAYGAILAVVFSVGIVKTLRQTIVAQKEYIAALEDKIKTTKAENEEMKKVQHEKDLLLEKAVATLDTIKTIPLETIAETLKGIQSDQKAIIRSANRRSQVRRAEA